MSYIEIYSDGGSRGNPGPAAYGIAVFSGKNEIYSEKKFIGSATNNLAEYSGLLAASSWLVKYLQKKPDINDVRIYLDSELIVRQINGVYKIKNESLKAMADKIKSQLTKLKARIQILHIKRDKNKRADQLVNQALDEKGALF